MWSALSFSVSCGSKLAEFLLEMLAQLRFYSPTRRLAFVVQIALTIGLVWSSCGEEREREIMRNRESLPDHEWRFSTDIEGLHSINATVNETVRVECRSNCTPPIRLHYMHEGSHESKEIKPPRAHEYSLTGQHTHPYITNATLFLNTTYNNTFLYCKAILKMIQTPTVKRGGRRVWGSEGLRESEIGMESRAANLSSA